MTTKSDSDFYSVFHLRTLRDIYGLPTYEQMVTCLDEVKECMMQARAANDLMVALNESGVKKAFEWPEVLEWKDDGKGEVATQYESDGKVMMEISPNDQSVPLGTRGPIEIHVGMVRCAVHAQCEPDGRWAARVPSLTEHCETGTTREMAILKAVSVVSRPCLDDPSGSLFSLSKGWKLLGWRHAKNNL